MSHASAVDRFGRIWVVGGGVCNVQSVRDSVLVFDPAAPVLGWQVMDTLNTARGFHAAARDPVGRIWAIGGGDYVQHFASAEFIDAPCAPDGWTASTAALPQPASTHAPVVLGADGLLYKTGGWVPHHDTAEVRSIDPREPTPIWMQRPSLNMARAGHSAVLGLDERIYVAGGEANGATSLTNVETFDTRPLLGDMNQDCVVDFFDIDGFLDALFGS